MDAGQQQEFEVLLHEERYPTMIPSMQTTFEKGKLEGEREGLLKGERDGFLKGKRDGERALLRLQLDKQFGPLSEDVLRTYPNNPGDPAKVAV
jgi:hypothetical protein